MSWIAQAQCVSTKSGGALSCEAGVTEVPFSPTLQLSDWLSYSCFCLLNIEEKSCNRPAALLERRFSSGLAWLER